MECKRAYFYLNLRGPGISPGIDALDADLAAELDRHLSSCPGCAAFAHARAAEDAALAKAMQAVPLPSSLLATLQRNLRTDLRVQSRKRLYRVAALAAAVLIAIGLGLGYNVVSRPRVNLDDWALRADFQVENADEATRQWLVEQNLPTHLPLSFDLSLLVFHGLERIQGREVPVLVFRARQGPDLARVYVCRDDQFANLKGLPEAQASHFTALALRDDRQFPGLAYIVLYTGNNLDRFLLARTQARA